MKSSQTGLFHHHKPNWYVKYTSEPTVVPQVKSMVVSVIRSRLDRAALQLGQFQPSVFC